MTRVVASYTTLPSRYGILKKSILSMKNQNRHLDNIYLTIPKKNKRLNLDYPPVPDDIQNLCEIVYVDTDYGPITKIYGALVKEKDPDTVIISCDDDVIFKPNFVEILLKHHESKPHAAICGTGALIKKGLFCISIVSTVEPFHNWKGFTGFNINKNGSKVDLVFGVAGVLYVRNMFPPNDFLEKEIFNHPLQDSDIFHNDDVLISGYLSKKKIQRLVFFDIPSVSHINGENALCGDLFNMFTRMHRSIIKVKEIGFFPQTETVNPDETPFWRSIIIAIIIILLILLSYYFYVFIKY